MYSSRSQGCKLCYGILAVILLGVSMLPGCDANLTRQNEVFDDAAQRVETRLLPIIVDESETVLRNLLNLLAALPEICSTPLATLGSFVSSMPVLGMPVSSRLDDTNGTWEMVWRGVVLGDNAPPLTVDTTTPGVDITLTVRFLSNAQQTLRAVPFSLAPLAALQTAGEPPSFAAGTVEGFFLFQNAATGEWTLRWRALGEPKVFTGTINAPVARVVRRVADGDAVTSLEVNPNATEIRFEESTDAADNKGFRFFVRPGVPIRFRLRIGPEGGEQQEITLQQLRIGALDATLAADQEPGNFTLSSDLPIDPSGAPAFTPGTEVGTFIWQDTLDNDCDAASEDQWRIRFSIQDSATTFSGTATVLEDDQKAQLNATAVGSCPAGSVQEGSKELSYDCRVEDDTPGGYDVCVSRGRRLTFSPEIDGIRDPATVFVGSQRAVPPSPYPDSILFDFEMTEPQSTDAVSFFDTSVFLRGNNDAAGALRLNPDQVSLDPFCSIPGETRQRLPRVRLTGDGKYATPRFEGSRYDLEEVEFTEDIGTSDNPLADSRRFPDRGDVVLKTRLEGDPGNTEITVQMSEITDVNGRAVAPLDVELNLSEVRFDFPNANFPDRARLVVE